jgi:hypothetical protein
MQDHHQRALEKARARLLEQHPDLLAIIVGGSIAKKIERPDSDVDLIIVVADKKYSQLLAESRVSFLWHDVCDYEGGYVEGRFVGKSFVLEAATRGSEPTRSSFTGVFPIFCSDEEIQNTIPKIAVYPQDQKGEKIQAFMGQLKGNQWFFWHEGKRRGDRYLQTRAATDIVLFGCRLILAENNVLFACQKRLVEQTLACRVKPPDFKAKLDRLLSEMSDEAMNDFCNAIENMRKWPEGDRIAQYQKDVEMSWYTRAIAVSEW